MKSTHTLAFFLLSIMLPATTLAASTSKEVTFDKTIKVGTTELQPGTYKVSWKGDGQGVEVDFAKGKDVVATTNADVQNGRSPYDAAVLVRNADSGSAVLEEIDFKNTQLVFHAAGEQSGN